MTIQIINHMLHVPIPHSSYLVVLWLKIKTDVGLRPSTVDIVTARVASSAL